MKKILALLLTVMLIALPVFANGEKEVADDGQTDIAVLIKATDSAFWNKIGDGALAYGKEHDNVNVTVQGPTSESDIEESISLLENVLLSSPDAIVIGSNAGEGASAAIADAKAAGIPVITIDTKLPSDDVVCHLATDNVKGGAYAADALVKALKDNGRELKGTVAIVAAVAGVQTIIDRDNGFIDQMAKIAPNIKVVDPQYVANDISTAMSTTENLVLTYGDELIGIYGDNNHTGDGVARAVEQAEVQNQVYVVAFDDDDEEIEACKKNVIKALIIQDQYNMGYSGVAYAMKAIEGTLDTNYVDTGVSVNGPSDF